MSVNFPKTPPFRGNEETPHISLPSSKAEEAIKKEKKLNFWQKIKKFFSGKKAEIESPKAPIVARQIIPQSKGLAPSSQHENSLLGQSAGRLNAIQKESFTRTQSNMHFPPARPLPPSRKPPPIPSAKPPTKPTEASKPFSPIEVSRTASNKAKEPESQPPPRPVKPPTPKVILPTSDRLPEASSSELKLLKNNTSIPSAKPPTKPTEASKPTSSIEFSRTASHKAPPLPPPAKPSIRKISPPSSSVTIATGRNSQQVPSRSLPLSTSASRTSSNKGLKAPSRPPPPVPLKPTKAGGKQEFDTRDNNKVLNLLPLPNQSASRTDSEAVRNQVDSTKESPYTATHMHAALLAVKPIAVDYTQTASIKAQRATHKDAKEWLRKNLATLGAEVKVITPPIKSFSPMSAVNLSNSERLNPDTFGWFNTQGVAEDIQRDGARKEENLEIIYGVASQYNGCEAPDIFTIAPRQAVEYYKNDRTQGPQAQLQFGREQVELINAGGGNKGFNSLVQVLDDTTKGAVRHGYLIPNSTQINKVTAQLTKEGHKMEFLSVKNKPMQGMKKGSKDVHQIFAAAPAFGTYNQSTVSTKQAEELQYVAALLAYRAQFAHVLNVAIESKQKGHRVIFKPTAVGLGVFRNNPEVIAKAFYTAAQEVYPQLREKGVRVDFQVFRGEGAAREMAHHLNLEEKF